MDRTPERHRVEHARELIAPPVGGKVREFREWRQAKDLAACDGASELLGFGGDDPGPMPEVAYRAHAVICEWQVSRRLLDRNCYIPTVEDERVAKALHEHFWARDDPFYTSLANFEWRHFWKDAALEMCGNNRQFRAVHRFCVEQGRHVTMDTVRWAIVGYYRRCLHHRHRDKKPPLCYTALMETVDHRIDDVHAFKGDGWPTLGSLGSPEYWPPAQHLSKIMESTPATAPIPSREYPATSDIRTRSGKREDDRPRHVYVLHATESDIYKIGVSVDPEERCKQWQRRFIEPLELVAVIEDGGERLERELHERFADQRVEPSGTVEAFYPCDELEALVEEHAV